MDYVVLRPPLEETFELPSRDELLQLKAGDLAKVRFSVGSANPERMWVILQDISDSNVWTGKIDNDAAQDAVAKVLPAGRLVSFHPLDIVAVE